MEAEMGKGNRRNGGNRNGRVRIGVKGKKIEWACDGGEREWERVVDNYLVVTE